MAGIDHTIIYFHNGMLMKDIDHWDWLKRDTTCETLDSKVHITDEIVDTTNEISLLPFYTNLLPFYTTRDGLFTKDGIVELKDMNRIFPNIRFNNKRKETRVIRAWDKNSWKTEEKYPKLDFKNRVYWYKDLNKLIITQHTENYCVTFYFKLDTKDSWVAFGGYGHYCNPYTHFYCRGYGEEFEKKMALELYRWICEDILTNLLDYCLKETLEEDSEYFIGAEYTQYYKTLAEILRFKHYYSMCNTKEDQEEYFRKDSMEYDPKSIFPKSKTFKEDSQKI